MSQIIGYPLGFIMWLFYQLFSSYSVSIVLFTIVVRLILFPLSVKQQKSTASMQAMQPKLEKIKKQYANNQQKAQEEQMKLYQEEGVNPMASCLPMLIQLPILYGIFDVVNRPITHILRFNKDIIEWAKDITVKFYETNPISGVSAAAVGQRAELYILKLMESNPGLFAENADFTEKVSSFRNTLFGFINLGDTPSFTPEVWTASAVGLVIIAVMSGVIQLIMTIYIQNRNKKMNPEGTAVKSPMAGMNIMMYLFPVMSVMISMASPGGLGFYWLISGLAGFVQSVILYKIYNPEYVASLIEKDKEKKKKKRKNPNSVMQRYQAMLEQQNAANNNASAAVERNKLLSSAAVSDEDDGVNEIKLSKSKQKEYERAIIAEARRRQAEKYGEEYNEDE